MIDISGMDNLTVLLVVEGLISRLPAARQEEIRNIRQIIETIVDDNGDNGKIAMALFIAEFGAKEDEQ